MQSTHCTFPGCERQVRARDYCSGHYWQQHQGRPLAPLRKRLSGSVQDRLDAYTDKSGDCWEWISSKNAKGYGLVCADGRMRLAHRVAYELEHGPVPRGLVLDHICRNPSCVRPEHLHVATVKENAENLGGARPGNRSGVRGVHWHSKNRNWVARVKHNGKHHYAGSFDTIEAAEAAVIAKRNELYTNNLADRT